MAEGRNSIGVRVDGDAMQPHEIAWALTRDRIAFTSERDRDALEPLRCLLEVHLAEVPPSSVHEAARRPGPDLWIIRDPSAIEIAWRARGWAGLVAVVGPSRSWLGDTQGRFVLVPELNPAAIVTLRDRGRELLVDSMQQRTRYLACSLRTQERMLRGALRLMKGCVTDTAALLGISRQLCQTHIRDLDEAFSGEPRAKFLREAVSGVMRRVAPRPRILIVEDDVLVARMLERILRGAGDCVIAHAAETARALFCDEEWDVVLLDIHLPGGNGLDILEQARKDKCRSSVIVLTGDDKKAYRDVAERLGIEAFLSKGADHEIDAATAENILFRVGSCLLRD